MIYFTSDFHFNHQKPFIYEPRGFSTAEEMNECIIQNFNKIVGFDDDVYVLGDLMLGGAERHQSGLDLISALNGKLHLVRGNHDSDKRWEAYRELHNVVEMENSIYLKYNHYHFYLSHYPSLTSNYDFDKPMKSRLLNLCGHTHTKDAFMHSEIGYVYHVELDCHDMKPVSIVDVIAAFYTMKATADEKAKIEHIQPRCDKCVYCYPNCGDSDMLGKCNTYKRDPPDGGYYG
jgi:calcineurin-like phosphoesterase family protein